MPFHHLLVFHIHETVSNRSKILRARFHFRPPRFFQFFVFRIIYLLISTHQRSAVQRQDPNIRERNTKPNLLELGKVQTELLGSGIDTSVLGDSLHSLGGEAKLDVAAELVGVVSLGLEVDVLDLLVALVGEGNDAGLTVGTLAEEVADTGTHLHVGAGRPLGGLSCREAEIGEQGDRKKEPM